MLGCQAPVLFMVFKQMKCSVMDQMHVREITGQVKTSKTVGRYCTIQKHREKEKTVQKKTYEKELATKGRKEEAEERYLTDLANAYLLLYRTLRLSYCNKMYISMGF